MWNPFRQRANLSGSGNNGPSSLLEPGDGIGELDDVAGSGTAPIVSVSVGTTGLNRAALYHRRMDALGCAGRIQSMLVYDCNQVNINRLREDADQNGLKEKIVLPEYLPFSEGFLRRVDQYERHYGAIERDMENMVEKMQHLALMSGTDPQVILEWLGFGGHAMLSYMFHNIVHKRFPEARILPIVCFPNDRSMHKNIRDHEIWKQTTEVFGSDAILLTDNRRGSNLQLLDENLTTGLAVVEGCFKYQNSFGSLAEAVSELNNNSNRWVAVESTAIPIIKYDSLGEKAGKKIDDTNRKRAIGKQAQAIKDRIFEIAQPENRFDKSAFYTPGARENDQRIYVTMPLDGRDVNAIRDDIEDQLSREEFDKAFPGTHICYADVNPRSRSEEQWQWIYIVKLVGLDEEPYPLSITSILNDEPLPDDILERRHNGVRTRGQSIIDDDTPETGENAEDWSNSV